MLAKGRVAADENDLYASSVFVVADLGSPGDRIAWWVTLMGGFLIAPDLQPASPFIEHAAAVCHPLKLWVSQQTHKKHPALYSLIKKAVASENSTWQLLTSSADFLVSVTKTGTVTKAVFTKHEIHTEKHLANDKVKKSAMTKEEFLKYVSRVNSRKLSA